jgi:esterase/lipase superfamily enzyme
LRSVIRTRSVISSAQAAHSTSAHFSTAITTTTFNFNSPYEYLPNMPDPWKYNHMSIIIGTGEWDVPRDESYRLSEVLNSKGLKHWLDDGKWRGHDWNYWHDMLPYYLSLVA